MIARLWCRVKVKWGVAWGAVALAVPFVGQAYSHTELQQRDCKALRTLQSHDPPASREVMRTLRLYD
jgi:hypothetical protein